MRRKPGAWTGPSSARRTRELLEAKLAHRSVARALTIGGVPEGGFQVFVGQRHQRIRLRLVRRTVAGARDRSPPTGGARARLLFLESTAQREFESGGLRGPVERGGVRLGRPILTLRTESVTLGSRSQTSATTTLPARGSHSSERPVHRARRPRFHPSARMAPRVGLEPTTTRLTAGCSTIELPGNSGGRPRIGATPFMSRRPDLGPRASTGSLSAGIARELQPACSPFPAHLEQGKIAAPRPVPRNPSETTMQLGLAFGAARSTLFTPTAGDVVAALEPKLAGK